MALLRQCLQEVRTKCGEHDAFAGAWLPAKAPRVRRGAGAPHPVQGHRDGDALATATRRLPAV